MANQDTKDLYPGEFLRVVAGSQASGLSLPGHGDRDELGVCLEPKESIYGLSEFEHHVYRTKPEGVASEPGDLDLTVYGLKKFLRLVMRGNPTIINILFTPPELTVHDSALAWELRKLTPALISQRARPTYKGYLQAQKKRIIEKTRAKSTNAEVPYVGKTAMHMIRLGIQGVELLTTGKVSLPMPREDADYCLAIRQCELSLKEVLRKADELEGQLHALKTTSVLPEQPDTTAVNAFLERTYKRYLD